MAVPSVWIAMLFGLLSTASGNILKHEPVVLGQTFMAGSTDPTAGSTGWSLTSHGIGEKLFSVDKEGKIYSQVAHSCRKLEAKIWEVTLKDDYKFSDGTAVTSQHVVDALAKLNEVNSGAQASLGTMTMTVLDTLKFKIESERATPVMHAVLAEWPFVVFLEKNGEYIFTGPYMVETFVTGDHIKLAPNPHYPRAAERPLLTIKKYANGESLATALETFKLDMAFHLPVDSLPTLRQISNITVKSSLVGYQYMAWHNMRRAPMDDLKVRKAVDLALDRDEMTQEVRAGKATRSFFPENTPYFLDGSILHAQKSAAEALLDEAGWEKNADGKRMKDGVALAMKVVAYPQRPALPTMLPVVKRNLEAVGITVEDVVTSGASWDELDAIMAAKDFDLLLWAQHTLPAGDPQFFINAFFRTGQGNNQAGLASSEIDSLIDDLSHAEMAASRTAATAAAHTAILEQVPVSILMTPQWHIGLSSRLSDYVPYGSDYYIVHADFGISAQSSDDISPTGTETDTSSDDPVDSAHWGTLSGFSIVSLLLLGSML